MKSNPEDIRWQELQSRLEQMHRRYLSGEVQTVRYQPGEMVQMFAAPAHYVEPQGQ